MLNDKTYSPLELFEITRMDRQHFQVYLEHGRRERMVQLMFNKRAENFTVIRVINWFFLHVIQGCMFNMGHRARTKFSFTTIRVITEKNYGRIFFTLYHGFAVTVT